MFRCVMPRNARSIAHPAMAVAVVAAMALVTSPQALGASSPTTAFVPSGTLVANPTLEERCGGLVARAAGVWEAASVMKISALGELKGLFTGTYDIRISPDGSYFQRNEYVLASGDIRQATFEGRCEGGRVVLEKSSQPFDSFRAVAWEASPNVILMEVETTQAGHTERYVETVYYISDNERVRTSQVVRDGAFDRLTVIRDSRRQEK